MADPVVHLTNGIPDSGTGNITTLGQTLLDGANVTHGATTDAAVAAGAAGSLSAKLRSISRDLVANISLAAGANTIGNVVLAAGSAIAGIFKIGDGTNVATVRAGSSLPAAGDTALVVTIRDINANGRNTPANSSPVVLASQIYFAVAASSSSQALHGSGSGATGDWLEALLVNPASTTPGNVTLIDNASTVMTFSFGTLADTRPFYIPVGALSASGAWKITTGTSVSVLALGNFT